jgi:quercetin dioxygenase-like cupin family protein
MTTAQILDRKVDMDQEATTAACVMRGGPLGATPLASRRLGAALAILGSLSVAVALVVPRIGGGGAPPPRPEPHTDLASVLDAWTVRTDGPVELSVQPMSYAPGQSSGWHTHPGLHLVSILSGKLTVYGPDCQPQTFGPGQPYLGGDRPHVARNETDAPLEMAVTYVARPGQSTQHFRTAATAPADCNVS